MRKYKKRVNVCAIILAIILVLGFAYTFTAWAFTGFGNADVRTWFANKEEQPEEEQPPVVATDENGEAMTNVGYYTLGQRISFGGNTTAGAENTTTSVNVTATITPAEATYKEVEYSVAWKNPSSTWANGKNVSDYLTAVQVESGSLQATINCLQAFGEQIEIKVTALDNAEATATCTVDYLKRITDINLTCSRGPSNIIYNSATTDTTLDWADFNYNSSATTGGITATPVYTYGVGTVQDTYTATANVKFTAAFETYAMSHVATALRVPGETVFGATYNFQFGDAKFNTGFTGFKSLCSLYAAGSSEPWTESQTNARKSDFAKLVAGFGAENVLEFTITATGTRNTNAYVYKTFAKLNAADFGVAVSSITLNPTEILF